MFESIGRERGERGRMRRWLVFGIALALHLAVLTALLGAQLWQVGAVSEPRIIVSFMTSPPAPVPAGGGGTPRKLEAKREVPAARAPQLVQPRQVLELVNRPPRSIDVVPSLPDTNAEPGPPAPPSDTIGPGPGLEGPPGPRVPIDDTLHLNAQMVKPEIIPGTRVEPRYTEPARKVHLQGLVVLEAVIDQRGNVVDLRVLRGLPMGLSEAALDAVSRWKFRPATLLGNPVKVYFTVTVDFRMN